MSEQNEQAKTATQEKVSKKEQKKNRKFHKRVTALYELYTSNHERSKWMIDRFCKLLLSENDTKQAVWFAEWVTWGHTSDGFRDCWKQDWKEYYIYKSRDKSKIKNKTWEQIVDQFESAAASRGR